MQITAPGLYPMDAEVYHADPVAVPSLSSGIAKLLIRQTPMHAHAAHPRFGASDFTPTSVMDDGSAVQAIFPDGSMITEECGARLRVWAETGADTRVSPQEQKIIDAVRDLVERIEDASSRAALDAILDEPNTAKQRDWLGGNRLAMSKQVEAAIDEAVARTAVAEDVAAD